MSADLFDLKGDDAIVLRVNVHAGAGRTAIIGTHGDALKIRVGASPTSGRANEACADLVAGLFGVKASQVELSSGQTNRLKRFTITGLDQDEAAHLLTAALEQAGSRPGASFTPTDIPPR